MATPTTTLRTLHNVGTGIDITVPSIQEEEAPLGGISILYEISVLTTLDIYKSNLHNKEDVVHFSIFKAYRELDDLHNKIQKKFPSAGLPRICKLSSTAKVSEDEKLNALDVFMKAVSQNVDICNCSILTQFIGVSPQGKNSSSSPKEVITKPKSAEIDKVLTPHIKQDTSDSSEEKNQILLDFGKKINDALLDDDDDMSDFTPKTQTSTTEKKSDFGKKKTDVLLDDNDDMSDFAPKTQTSTTEKRIVAEEGQAKAAAKNIDLFEEVKLSREITNKIKSEPQSSTSKGLFDDFEDDNLFSTDTKTSKKEAPVKSEPVKKKNIKPNIQSKVAEKNVEQVSDKEIIFEDRSLGDVSLFQEQDLGDYITKDEEDLFLVTTDNKEKSKLNTLLFKDDVDSSTKDQTIVDDNLDDLLNLEPLLPENVPERKSKEVTADEEVTKEEQPSKPIPLPRKKSLGSTDIQEKPEVLPRKVFMNNPPVAAKPVVPPKPKPKLPTNKPSVAPKPGKKNTTSVPNDVTSEASTNQGLDLTDDLNKMDILKYIEQEQQVSAVEASLFD